MNKRKLRAGYRRYLFSFGFETIEVLPEKALPKLELHSEIIKPQHERMTSEPVFQVEKA